MIKLYDTGIYLLGGTQIVADEAQLVPFTEENMDGACRLELEDGQYEFILDARSCICRAYALRDRRFGGRK